MDNYFLLPSFWHKLLAALLLLEIGFVLGLFYFFPIFDYQFVYRKFEPPAINQTQNAITKKYLENVLAKTTYPEKSGIAQISGIIVNHHLLADQLIARGLYLAATDSPLTIVLLSPNHFGGGFGSVIAASQEWRTPAGYLRADQDVLSALSEARAVEIDDRPFEQEHGITNILPFIKKFYPQARIVPIIIKDGLSNERGDLLVQKLLESLPENSLIVASLDFSHYRASAEADVFDKQTLNVIRNNDYNKVSTLNKGGQPDNVDSAPTLRIMLELMSQKGSKFVTLDHTSAAKLTGNLASKDNTSYIVGAFYK